MIPRGIISADGHVCEPPNCYVDYIDPKYRDNAPRVVPQSDGTEAFVVPGMKRPVALGFIDGAGFSIKERNDRAKRIKFADIREAAYGGRARLPYMDLDGIAAEIVYASVGMGLCMHRDAEYKDACMKAYNRWLQAMCSEAPNRIFGLGQTAVLSVDGAIEDFRRAKEMGMVDMMMPGRPIHEDYDHPDQKNIRAEENLSPGIRLVFESLLGPKKRMFYGGSPRRGDPRAAATARRASTT